MWFGLLTTHKPGILAKLEDVEHGVQMQLHLKAVREVLHDLAPPLDQDDKHQLFKWLSDIQLLHTSIDSVLRLKSQASILKELK